MKIIHVPFTFLPDQLYRNGRSKSVQMKKIWSLFVKKLSELARGYCIARPIKLAHIINFFNTGVATYPEPI